VTGDENHKEMDGNEAPAAGSAPGPAQSGAPADSGAERPAAPAPSELEEALREKEQFKKLLQRVQADFINFRNRSQEESRQARKAGVRALALRVIDVLDLFDAAMSATAAAGVEAKWVDGVRAIQRSLASALAGEGVQRVAPSGAAFDPRTHEALISTPTADVPPGTVLRELRPGYLYDGEVIRPAQVEVAAAPPDDAPAGEKGDRTT
jgi:molecular chaperone GrpE